MFSRFAVLALSLLVGASATVINSANGDIPVDSHVGHALLKNARQLANSNSYNSNGQSKYSGNYQEVNWNEIDTSYIAGYSIKFQGCHHVQQWNDDADGEDDIKILTQRLVRFRLCPANACSAGLTAGCDSNYGDYVVDMETYVGAYLDQMQNEYMNGGGGGRHLANNGNSYNKYNINLSNYMSCGQMESNNNNRELANNNQQQYYYNSNGQSYYVGPYCAEQGGEIRLGTFLDDTCSIFADDGADAFKAAHGGMALPYSDHSMVNMNCISCGGYGQVNEMCDTIYKVAGKCETKMSVYYPNESACAYIDGIKIIREDGVIRTSATRKSKAAAVSIGVFLTAAVLLAGYVYYLRTKLGRAKINLQAASQNL
ncbi:hypothetical protein IV203_036719 [Nitzschia inconspicua]|uniref:Uncharacterized protein n=1 Tax=Nitzschia inconspicua TaxID=303405 RepID=A0A9K3PVW6_9STRA|nr:hypothetical protein IV203_036719 [Nitzschia inconspicua]